MPLVQSPYGLERYNGSDWRLRQEAHEPGLRWLHISTLLQTEAKASLHYLTASTTLNSRYVCTGICIVEPFVKAAINCLLGSWKPF